MNKFIRFICMCVAACLVAATAACSSAGVKTGAVDCGDPFVPVPGGVVPSDREAYGDGMAAEGEAAFEGVAGKTDAESGAADGGTDEKTEDETEKPDDVRPAGLVTAAAWNDNVYYDAWTDLFVKGQGDEDSGKFAGYNGKWSLDSLNRVKVTVTDGENKVSGAKVAAYDESGKCVYSAVSGADGVAYLFPGAEKGTVRATVGDDSVTAAFDGEDRDVVIETGASEKADVIEIMFVIDVTGSMGDELRYLGAELTDVISRVCFADGDAVVRLALLFYRDDGDEEKFAYSDFVRVDGGQGLESQIKAISSQRATGGGDYPEAVDEALELAVSKNWSDGSATKLIFHVLDAPPHDKNANGVRFRKAVLDAAEKGIRISPIICSGANDLCEYLMRQAAVLTGGTFVFVTDDSGIGYAHHDPGLPNAVVEKLNDLLVRLISGYHTGVFAEPVNWKESETVSGSVADQTPKGAGE